LLTIGWDPMLGARPLRRAIQHEVEDMLSEQILHGELHAGSHVVVDFVDGEFTADTTGALALPDVTAVEVEAIAEEQAETESSKDD
jgi:ATP-dependent Clp protease ATP-binding subunit ClpC